MVVVVVVVIVVVVVVVVVVVRIVEKRKLWYSMVLRKVWHRNAKFSAVKF